MMMSMLPRVDAREIGRLNDAGALVAAVQISRANGSRHRIAVEHLTGVDGVVFDEFFNLLPLLALTYLFIRLT